MNKTEKLKLVQLELDNLYGETKCFLNYSKDYELLFAIMLSAQTTDKSVNNVTSILFEKYKSLEEFSKADINELITYLMPLGLAKNKAKHLLKTANILHNDFNDIIPKNREELIKLPGIGYKTATVFLAELYNYPSIPVDTHIKRVISKLNIFPKISVPTKISQNLDKFYKENNHINFHRQLILFGRNICTARNPKCNICPFSKNLCKQKN